MQIKRAQTFIEYLLVISVVTIIMIAMSSLLRRSVQGMVKAVADQVGFQQNAEQQINGTDGQLTDMVTKMQRDERINVRDRLGNIMYTYEIDYTATQSQLDTRQEETED